MKNNFLCQMILHYHLRLLRKKCIVDAKNIDDALTQCINADSDMSNEKVSWGANKVLENAKLDKICGSYLASQMKLSRIEKIT